MERNLGILACRATTRRTAQKPTFPPAWCTGRLQGNSTSPDTGARNYANSVQNVSADFGSCFDARYSAYTSLPGYRCPATLSYSIAKLEGPSPDVYQAVVEPYSIDVNLNRPPFTSAQTLNDFIDRYPLAGSQPLSPVAIANIINAMFVQASSRAGYDGINYFPITAADVVSALQPGEVVPLSSLVAPVAGTGAGTGNPAIPGTDLQPLISSQSRHQSASVEGHPYSRPDHGARLRLVPPRCAISLCLVTRRSVPHWSSRCGVLTSAQVSIAS